MPEKTGFTQDPELKTPSLKEDQADSQAPPLTPPQDSGQLQESGGLYHSKAL